MFRYLRVTLLDLFVYLCLFRVGPQELAETLLIYGAGCKFENGLRSGFLARRKTITIELGKKYANDKTGALVTIDEGMVLHNTGWLPEPVAVQSGVQPLIPLVATTRCGKHARAHWR
jgi:hypothetical protein